MGLGRAGGGRVGEADVTVCYCDCVGVCVRALFEASTVHLSTVLVDPPDPSSLPHYYAWSWTPDGRDDTSTRAA